MGDEYIGNENRRLKLAERYFRGKMTKNRQAASDKMAHLFSSSIESPTETTWLILGYPPCCFSDTGRG